MFFLFCGLALRGFANNELCSQYAMPRSDRMWLLGLLSVVARAALKGRAADLKQTRARGRATPCRLLQRCSFRVLGWTLWKSQARTLGSFVIRQPAPYVLSHSSVLLLITSPSSSALACCAKLLGCVRVLQKQRARTRLHPSSSSCVNGGFECCGHDASRSCS